MIETLDQLYNFISLSIDDDILLYVVPLHEGIHSSLNSASILFIYNIPKNKTYYYGINHPDVKCISSVEHSDVFKWISTMRGKKWAVDKKSTEQLIPIENTLDVGLITYLRNNKVFDILEFETSAHKLIRKNSCNRLEPSKLIPLSKHLEMFSEIVDSFLKSVGKIEVDSAFLKFNDCIISPLGEIEKSGLEVNPSIFGQHFGNILNTTRVYSQYNVYTSTGRPSNRFGGINYAALNKEDGSRAAFVSRFGKSGKLVLIDYSAFHPRIIAFLTGYSFPPSINIYEYLAKLYFNRPQVDDEDISESKKITFRQLFGGVQEEYRHIKYLANLKTFIDENWNWFTSHGYVETPIFKRKITDKHIKNPKPATVFNYILQATEGEISIPILGKVNEVLRKKQTKAILYTYDSILFDYCLDDGSLMSSIREIMEMDHCFPTKMYIGDNYNDMQLYQ